MFGVITSNFVAVCPQKNESVPYMVPIVCLTPKFADFSIGENRVGTRIFAPPVVCRTCCFLIRIGCPPQLPTVSVAIFHGGFSKFNVFVENSNNVGDLLLDAAEWRSKFAPVVVCGLVTPFVFPAHVSLCMRRMNEKQFMAYVDSKYML